VTELLWLFEWIECPEGGRKPPVIKVPGVTGSGAEGAGNASWGDRAGASDGSGGAGPRGFPPRKGDRSGSTASERGGLGDGGVGGKRVPSLPPQGQGGSDGRAFPSIPPEGVEDGAGGVFPPPPRRPLGERGQAVPPLPWGPYDGRDRPARAAGPHRASPHGGEDPVPQWAPDEAVLSVALRDSLEALISPLHERLSIMEN